MSRGMGDNTDFLLEHYLVVCIFFTLFILTWLGVGDIFTVSVLGLILCAVGLAQPRHRVDTRVLALLVVCNLFSMASSCAVYGNITDGYASVQIIFPVLFFLTEGLDGEERRLLRRLCVIWTGITAGTGIIQFVYSAVASGYAGRLGGFLGNPNAMGIFLVIGWFALMDCLQEQGKGGHGAAGEAGRERNGAGSMLFCVEPILLMALALTLSMGSFVAMAGGICVALFREKRTSSCREVFRYACRILARVSLGVGVGVLIYLAAARTDVPWICLPLLFYALLAAGQWRRFGFFLGEYPWMAVMISCLGLLVAATVVFIRPSSLATFAERLEMMRNGIGYMTQGSLKSWLLGTGPYQWRMLNMHDGDKYFNTWHIHNALIHVGVELGWIAMLTLALAAVRIFRKSTRMWTKAGFAAFCIHNMMDTSFFYPGITALALLTVGNCGEFPEESPAEGFAGRIASKIFPGAAFCLFAWNLFCILQAA